MKRILYICNSDLAVRHGGALCQKAYLNALNKIIPGKVDVVLPEEFCVKEYEEAIKVPKRSILKVITSLCIHRFKSFMKDFLKENADKYSHCIINHGTYAGDMMDMIHKYGIKIMVIHHNYEKEYHMDNRDALTLKGHYAGFVVRNERNAYRKADVNCFLTKSDLNTFRKVYGYQGNCHVTGVFETDDKPLPEVGDFPKENLLGITGSMNTVQTILGVMDLKDNYFDILKNKMPDWKIIIAGRNPSDKIQQFAQMNNDVIQLIPNPENMDDVVGRCKVFICPTNVGGGLKLRVMDGLRLGLPVFTHEISARGYDDFFDLPFFNVYNDRKSFEKGIDNIMKIQFNAEMRKHIQNTYLDSFGFNAGMKRFKVAWDVFI